MLFRGQVPVRAFFPQVTDNTVQHNGKKLPSEIANHTKKKNKSLAIVILGTDQRIHKLVDKIC